MLLWLLPSAQAMAACSVATTAINFGSYDTLGLTPVDSVGGISVVCTQSGNLTVAAMIGPSATTGIFIPRSMRISSGADILTYNLYTQAARSVVWGDGTGGTVTQQQKVKQGSPWNAVVYGRIPPGQDVAAGAYSDTLTVTIVY